mmetsp:Transcript_30896/g.54322  ORF Transcript_30896/g.54322 Transcript_30896/m.54322 type:complete len:127 (-) Transcript_30896:9-389(-)
MIMPKTITGNKVGCALATSKQEASVMKGELNHYFEGSYLCGESFHSAQYKYRSYLETSMFEYTASDGKIRVWAHALDLRCFAPKDHATTVLFHYTSEMAFMNLTSQALDTVELFASLVEERAHFGL